MTRDEERILHGEVVSLRDYFERVISDQDRRILQTQQSAGEAIDKADRSLERRLDLLNEFRAQAEDQSQRFALREIVDERLGKVERSISLAQGAAVVAIFIGFADLIRLFIG